MDDQGEAPKIGAGHLAAMGRLGLKELSQALVALPDSIRPIEEPGMAGNLTPGEVMQGKNIGRYEAMLNGAQQAPEQPILDRGIDR